MTDRPAAVFILAGLGMVLALFGCAKEPPEITGIQFTFERVIVQISCPLEIQWTEITTESGTSLAHVLFSKGYSDSNVKIDFKWSENTRYWVRVKTKRRELSNLTVSPQQKIEEPFTFDFPFGMHGRHALVPGETQITGSLRVKNNSDFSKRFDVYVSFSKGFQIADHKDKRYGRTPDGIVEFHDRVDLSNQYDSILIDITVISPDQSISESGSVLLNIVEDHATIFQRAIELRMVESAVLSRHIQVFGIDFPTNIKGKRDERLMQGILQLTPGSKFVSVITGKAEDDVNHRIIPPAFYTVGISNTMPEDVAVIIKAWVTDKEGGKHLEAFRPHLHVNSAGEIFSSAILPGNSRERIIMPVYVEPAMVLPGNYQLCYSITQFGTATPFYQGTYSFKVAKQPMIPMMVTAAGALLAAIYILLLIIFFKRIYGSFKVRWIILAALYGAVGFVGVNIPGLFLANLFHALLGPFSFLATGMFYGVVQYMLWGSLIVLVPRKGMMTLVFTVRMLLSGVMLGHFSAVFVIYVFVQAFLLELLLLVAGCTKSRPENGQLNGKAIIFAFIVSDVLSTFFNFESSILLYRLYYANWFVFLNCIINGGVYTLIGIQLGLNTGKKLKMVVE